MQNDSQRRNLTIKCITHLFFSNGKAIIGINIHYYKNRNCKTLYKDYDSYIIWYNSLHIWWVPNDVHLGELSAECQTNGPGCTQLKGERLTEGCIGQGRALVRFITFSKERGGHSPARNVRSTEFREAGWRNNYETVLFSCGHREPLNVCQSVRCIALYFTDIYLEGVHF